MDNLDIKLLNEILDNECLLEDVLINLINIKKLDLAEELLKKVTVPPHEVIIKIFDDLDKKAFNQLANYFRCELSADHWDSKTEEYTGTLAMYLATQLECIVPSIREHKDTKHQMKLWLEENYITIRCPHCKTLLTNEPETELYTIYTKACIPLTFNRKDDSFDEDGSERWQSQEDFGKYYCSRCHNDISEIVKNYI